MSSLLAPIQEPDDTDYKFADEILKLHSVLRSPADGEWKWIHDNKKQSYMKALQQNDREALATILSNLFRMDASYGLISCDVTENPVALESSLLLDIDAWKEFTEQDDMSYLSMPNVGNPYGASIDDTLICCDQPRHDYFALKIKSLEPETVLEIGGGYGGLALQLSRRAKVQYINCDLPETLYLAYYFLSRAGKRVEWAIDEWPQDAEMIFVPANKKEKVPDEIDLVFNANSLSEMSRETVQDYLQSINNTWKPRYFLHQNSNFLLFPDSPRHVEVLARDFPIDKTQYSEVYRAIALWQGAGGRYREFLYERLTHS